MASPTKQPLDHRSRPVSDDETAASTAAGTNAATTETVPPSHHLYVGNLSLDTTESELTALFSKYGVLDRVTAYPSRNYAFVYFKHVNDAKAAKDTLQGALVRGNSIKIQYAKPAKASKHLWIGGLSPAVTRKQLEDEFSKFGEIEELKLLKDRNSAFVDYRKIDDAADAMKNMDGKSLCGEKIRVDYVRSQPSRRDWTDYHERWPPAEPLRNFPSTSQLGHKRPLSNEGRKGGQQPSKVLWIRYPPSVPIDEQMLHNALILFGEIERIKTFPERNCSFVEFRSVDEACRAKEGLEGRLFNDSRIQIMFSHSELVANQDGSSFLVGNRGPQADSFFSDPFGAVDVFPPSGLIGSNNLPGHLPSNVMRGPNVHVRPFAQAFDPIHGGPEFGEASGFADGNPIPWRRGSPSAPGILPSPGIRPPVRTSQGAWDEIDGRDPKRSRFDGPSLIDVPLHARRMGSQEPYGLPQVDRDPLARVHPSPIRINGSPAKISSRNDSHGVRSVHCWRGLIAKGGTPVCHARCIPIENGIDSPIPEVVNCSARTGLDMLAKHYAEASGFDIVFFLPDSEEDFASYTEFLHYLGAKNRAGVAKFDDGTTLFLVPPSDFLRRTLKVSGPERLYGIVLKLPQQSSTVNVQHPQAIPPISQFANRQQLPPQIGYTSVPQNEDRSRPEYSRIPWDGSEPHVASGLLVPHTDELRATPPSSLGYVSNITGAPQVGVSSNITAAPHLGVSLPQDLLASLASLIPSNVQSSTTGTVQLPLNATRLVGSSVAPDKVVAPQIWSQAHQEQLHQSSQQIGLQVSNQSSQVQFPNYANTGNVPDHSMQTGSGGIQVQDPAVIQNVNNMHTKLTDGYAYLSQGGASTPLASQQYHADASYGSHKSYAMTPAMDMAGGYNSSVQQSVPPSVCSTQDQSGQILQTQNVHPLATDKGRTELPAQLQQLQAALSNSAQSTPTVEADKNQRYQSTLQFAASLLLQIQQQQQQKQGNTQPLQGSGNQQ